MHACSVSAECGYGYMVVHCIEHSIPCGSKHWRKYTFSKSLIIFAYIIMLIMPLVDLVTFICYYMIDNASRSPILYIGVPHNEQFIIGFTCFLGANNKY